MSLTAAAPPTGTSGSSLSLETLDVVQKRVPLARREHGSPLGVNDFGQSGDIPDLYAHFQIDADTIVGAALDLVQG